MKKRILFILSAVFMISANNLFAQEQELKVKEPGRTEFEKHWFMQISSKSKIRRCLV